MRGWIAGVLLSLILFGSALPAVAQPGCYTPQQAAAYAGEYGCVTGRVTTVFWAQESNGRPTFVDMGTQFTVVIWEENRPAFQPPPESWRGATLTVWGEIGIFRGKAQIILRSPSQFAPPPAVQPTAPAPTPLPVRIAPPMSAPVQTAAPVPPQATMPPPAPQATPIPTPLPTPEPSPEPTTEPTPPPTPEPTPSPFPASPGTPIAQARVIATPVLEGPIDDAPPITRPQESGGPPTMLIAGAVALLVLGVGGSILAGRRGR